MPEARRQLRSPVDVPGEVGETPIEMVHRPDLPWGREEVEHQTNGEGLGQPRVAALGHHDPADDPSSEGKQGDPDNDHDDRV